MIRAAEFTHKQITITNSLRKIIGWNILYRDVFCCESSQYDQMRKPVGEYTTYNTEGGE